MRMDDCEIQTSGLLVITHSTLEEHTIVTKDISLASLPLAKTVEDRFRDRIAAISDCVDTAVPAAHNLVCVGTITKLELRILFQNLAVGDGFQSATHSVGQALCGFINVALRTGVVAHITNSGQLVCRPPSGERFILVLPAQQWGDPKTEGGA